MYAGVVKNLSFASSVVVVAATIVSSRAEAAPPWVARGLTLPRGVWAFDVGLGVGHRPDVTGAGLNTEVAIGVTHALELGFRSGFRLNGDAQATQADQYGRLFDTETYGTDGDNVANPEFRVRGSIARGDVAEVGLEGRAYLPIENGTRAGLLLGVPVTLHLGGTVRLDTGVFVPILFYDPTRTIISIPIAVWIQSTDRFWLGPFAAVRFHNDPGTFTQVLVGFGLGYQLARQVDFKAQFIFPDINGSPEQGSGGKAFGAGAGLQLRID